VQAQTEDTKQPQNGRKEKTPNTLADTRFTLFVPHLIPIHISHEGSIYYMCSIFPKVMGIPEHDRQVASEDYHCFKPQQVKTSNPFLPFFQMA
jgi:hypothetical protein